MTPANVKIPLLVLALSVWGCSEREMSAPDPATPLLSSQTQSSSTPPSAASTREFIDRYCAFCHDERLATAGLRLDLVDFARVAEHPEVLEKVVRKLRTGIMPPPEMPQPSVAGRSDMLAWLEASLDEAAVANPNPGRTEALRRLNRTEYQNAIRDLLALDIDATSLLPADESGHGLSALNGVLV